MLPWSAVSLISLVLSSLLAPAHAQIVYDSDHNKTAITGTWASGSKNVVTGSGFANPANLSFTYPPTTGVSYSFSADGFYEVARYRFTANGTNPSCIIGVLNWAHGTFDLVSNGSIIFNPFGDGYQQVQNPCAAISNQIENFNVTELYQSWQIFEDPVDGFKLHLFQFDGSPVAPLFQLSADPNMLPTQMLRNVTEGFTSQNGFVSTGTKRELQKRSAAAALNVDQVAQATLLSGLFIGLASLLL